MNFEDQLRDRLQSSARDLDVTGRGMDHVVGRARARQRHKRAALGSLAGVAVLAGSIGYVARRDSGPNGQLAVGTPGGLTPSGPLDLTWAVDEGGVTSSVATSVAPDGTIYALSTAPGVRADEQPPIDTLYAMGEDGTWRDAGVGSASDLADLAAGSSLLYGVGTAPSTKGDGFVPVVATSSDDGASWSRKELPAAELPSTVVTWLPSASVKVAAVGDTGVAVVSTTFSIPAYELPGVDLAEDDAYDMAYTDDGIVVSGLVRLEGGGANPTSTLVPSSEADARAAKSGEASGGGYGMAPIRTVPWSELGISGPDDLHRTDVYVTHGDRWTPVPSEMGPLDYVAGLTVVGDELVLSASQPTESNPSTSAMVYLASSDGEQWRPVAVPSDDGRLAGLGSTWVVASSDGRGLLVSDDRGGSWRAVGLPDGTPSDGMVYQVASGPLGLAVTVQTSSGGSVVAVTRDLMDWAVLDLAQLGIEPDLGPPSVIVGADRVVVTLAVRGDGDPGSPSRSRTIIGTPVRVATTTAPPSTAGTVPPTSEAPASTTTEPVRSTTTTAPPSTTTSVTAAP